jgi:hypothetical protein
VPPHLEQSAPRPEQAVARVELAQRPLAARGAPTARLRAAARSVRRVRERRSAPHCSGTVRYAAAGAAYLRLQLRASLSKAQFESAVRLSAGWLTPEALVWRPQEVAQFESAAQLPAGWAMPGAIVWHPRAVVASELVRSSAEAAGQARRLAG